MRQSRCLTTAVQIYAEDAADYYELPDVPIRT